MQARLEVDGCRDLYQFWGNRLARQLASETDLYFDSKAALLWQDYGPAAVLEIVRRALY